jgi:hypothetical protein
MEDRAMSDKATLKMGLREGHFELVIDFGEQISWLMLDKDEVLRLSQELLRYAAKMEFRS